MTFPVSHPHASSLAFGDMPLAGATAVVLAGGAIGAAIDTAQGAPARELFAVFLALAAVIATFTVRRHDVPLTVTMVPLAYLVLLLIGTALADDGTFASSFVYAFIVKAPVVLIATAAAVVAALIRHLSRG
ncbi:MAG TPA: DUF6542 domain-containing protein [Mycobacteriales bacterium]